MHVPRPVGAARAALALLTTPTAASAAWRAQDIPGTQGAQPPSTLAVDATGRGLILFEAFDQQHAPQRFTGTAVRAPGGEWTRGPDVRGVGWAAARALLYGKTRALLVTRQVTGYGAFHRARFRLAWAPGTSDGTFGALRQIDASADVPASAANAAGAALVAYARQGGSVLRVSERTAGHGFGRPRVISPAGSGSPAVAINARGDRVVAWLRSDRLEARVRRAGHGWGSVLTAARVVRSAAQSVRAAISPAGRILLSWEAVDVREDRPVALDAGVAVRGTTGGWHAATLEHGVLATESFAADPVAVPLVGSAGDLLVAYTGRVGGGTGAKLAPVAGTGRVGTPVVVSGESQAATVDDAAAGGGERVAVTWSEHDAGGAVRTLAALRPGPGAFEAPAVLTPAGQSGLVGSRVTFSPLTGEAIVVRPFAAPPAARLAAAVSDPAAG